MDLARLPNDVYSAGYCRVLCLHRHHCHSFFLGGPGASGNAAASHFPYFRDPPCGSSSSCRACQKIAGSFGHAKRSMTQQAPHTIQRRTKRMQATARMASVVSPTAPARLRLILVHSLPSQESVLKLASSTLVLFVLAACAPLRVSQQDQPMPRTPEFSITVYPGVPNQPSFNISETQGHVTLNDEPLSRDDILKFKTLQQDILQSPKWKRWATSPSGTDLPWTGPRHESWDIDFYNSGLRIPRIRIPQSWLSRMMSIHTYIGAKPSEP
jgi:hypothetical protein